MANDSPNKFEQLFPIFCSSSLCDTNASHVIKDWYSKLDIKHEVSHRICCRAKGTFVVDRLRTADMRTWKWQSTLLEEERHIYPSLSHIALMKLYFRDNEWRLEILWSVERKSWELRTFITFFRTTITHSKQRRKHKWLIGDWCPFTECRRGRNDWASVQSVPWKSFINHQAIILWVK